MAEKLILEFIGKDEVSKTASGIGKALGGMGSVAAGVATGGLVLAAGAAVGLGAALVSGIGDAMEAQEVQAQLGAVLQSTGGIAGVTADMANELANSMEGVTRFSAESTLAGENMLLTFTNIGSDVFPMATQTMLDMSQAMGQDVTQTAIQLGKALNDPVQGVTALQRVGVQLSDEQKELVASFMEVGDIASAQGVILQELQKEFGGSAVAAGQTLPGQMDILQNKLGEVKETIGAAFLPVLQQVAGLLITALNAPATQQALANIAAFITTVVVPAIVEFVGWIKDEVVPRLKDFWYELTTALKPALQSLYSAFQQIIAAFGISTGEIDILDVAFATLDITLRAIVIVAKGVATVMTGVAHAIEAIASAVKWAIDKFEDFKASARGIAGSLPYWMLPGSPTPLELGLRGIGKALGDVNAQFGGVTVNGGGGGGGSVLSSVVVNLSYAPAVSLADRYEAEYTLAPLIANAVRRELGTL